MSSPKVGGEVDAYCTRCRLALAHTVLAMVGTKVARVRCNTCGGDHAYRSAPGTTEKAAPRAAPKAKVTREVISFDQLLEKRSTGNALPYSPKDSYTLDQVVTHPSFGLGFVSAVRGDKVDITFRSEVKTLVHGRSGGAPAARPAFQAPHARSALPADKPEAPVQEEKDSSAV